ncbi:hypothetical protein BTVI_56065 [Pitangus sulphuratus]|nr:hypothetical protein BTVI_56065 [Pitangus sulphuratus]
MGLDGIHPRIQRDLVEVFTKAVSVIYQQSWITKEVQADWKSAKVTLIYRKIQKKDPGNFSPISLNSAAGKIMEQIILSAIMQQGNQGIRPGQCGIVKGRSCLTNLISFYDKVDEGWKKQQLFDPGCYLPPQCMFSIGDSFPNIPDLAARTSIVKIFPSQGETKFTTRTFEPKLVTQIRVLGKETLLIQIQLHTLI